MASEDDQMNADWTEMKDQAWLDFHAINKENNSTKINMKPSIK